jgi:uncharacterized membrane protein YccC
MSLSASKSGRLHSDDTSNTSLKTCQVGLARYCDAMSSALAQTLIGGALAIIGGLVATWLQLSRSDNVAKKIRRAERYESALIELNARAAETVSQVCKVWGDTRSARLLRSNQKKTGASEYDRVHEPLDKLLDHWQAVSSLVISDTTIVEAFARLHRESAEHVWREGSMAYDSKPPIDGWADTTQLLQDLEAVSVAVSDAGKEVRLRVAALHDAPRSPLRAITATTRINR